METYSKWADVPEHLKTQTAIKQAGMRRRPKQGVIATIDTRWGSHGGGDCLVLYYGLARDYSARPAKIIRSENFEAHRKNGWDLI